MRSQCESKANLSYDKPVDKQMALETQPRWRRHYKPLINDELLSSNIVLVGKKKSGATAPITPMGLNVNEASSYAVRVRLTETELSNLLRLRVAAFETANHRAKSFFGRFINWTTGENVDYVRFTGTQLIQLFQATESNLSSDLEPLANYGTPLASAQELQRRMTAKAEENKI